MPPLDTPSSESEGSPLKRQIESVLEQFERDEQEIICRLFGLRGERVHLNEEVISSNVNIEDIRRLRALLLRRIQEKNSA